MSTKQEIAELETKVEVALKKVRDLEEALANAREELLETEEATAEAMERFCAIREGKRIYLCGGYRTMESHNIGRADIVVPTEERRLWNGAELYLMKGDFEYVVLLGTDGKTWEKVVHVRKTCSCKNL
jgi:hypothetical protein